MSLEQGPTADEPHIGEHVADEIAEFEADAEFLDSS